MARYTDMASLGRPCSVHGACQRQELPSPPLSLAHCQRRPLKSSRPARRQHGRCSCAADAQQTASVPPDVQQDLHWQVQIREGPVTIAPLRDFEVAGAAVLVARAFAGSPGLFSFDGIVSHYNKILSQADKARGLILSARLVPTDPKLLPKRRDSLMIGTMCISYDEESLEEDLFPPLPPEAAYVTNLAVDGRFRRQGVAAALLSAGEEVTFNTRACRELCLHVREKDTGAQQFYKAAGYLTKNSDSPGLLGFIRGQRRQFLMSKLQPPS